MAASALRMNFAHFRFDPVEDLLGEGPLSEVYRAVDEKLDRTVALKILRAHVELDPEADRRFEREAKHTSHLAHPNIATIYEYGEDSGRRYIAMEYLQGRTLEKIIKDDGLGVDECLRVANQVSSALALVHKAGLIHRDLKPANVMVQNDGTVKLLDFGIARAKGEATLTQHGMLVGTVLYMAPEQVRGDELDARSDIFAFGALCYHALTGHLPFPGNSFPEVCMAILDGSPAAPSQLKPGMPQALEDFILKCMEPEPQNRYANAEVAHGVLMAVIDNISPGRAATGSNYLSGSLAIAPLGWTGEASVAGLAASLRKDLSKELSRAGLSVSLPEADTADELGQSDFAVHGEVSLGEPDADGSLMGTLELVLERAGSAGGVLEEVWRHSLQHADQDEWGLQAQLVRSAVRSLRRQIAENAMTQDDNVQRDPELGRKLCQRAHDVLHRGITKHLLASMTLFRRALEADPKCALAYSGLSESLVRKYLYWDGDESFLRESRENASRALSIDPSCAEAHTALGFGYQLAGLHVDAQREYRLAIQLSNEEWLAHRLLGSLLSREGNFKAASPLLQRAIALRPSYISTYDRLYHVLQRLDRYEEAIETADRGMSAGKARLKKIADDQDTRVHVGLLQARMGLRDAALASAAEAHELAPKDGFTSFHVGLIHAVLGNQDLAIEALTNAEKRGYCVRSEKSSPEFDSLRGLEAFNGLMS